MPYYFKKLLIFSLGLSLIFGTGSALLKGIFIQPAYAYTDGTLIKAANDPNIYIINNNVKVWVRSAEVFNNCGYNWNNLTNVVSLDAVSTADLIKKSDNPDVYRLEKDFKRKLASIEIFNSYGLDWNKIAVVCPYVSDSYTWAPLMKIKDSDVVYKIAYELNPNRPEIGLQTTPHRYRSWQAFLDDGKSTKDIIEVSQLEFESYGAEGAPMYERGSSSGISAPYLFDPGLSIDTGSSFTISWTHPGGHLINFRLEEATDNNFSDATLIYTGKNNYTLQTANPQKTTKYYYRVKSFDQDNQSIWSNVVDMIVCFPVC